MFRFRCRWQRRQQVLPCSPWVNNFLRTNESTEQKQYSLIFFIKSQTQAKSKVLIPKSEVRIGLVLVFLCPEKELNNQSLRTCCLVVLISFVCSSSSVLLFVLKKCYYLVNPSHQSASRKQTRPCEGMTLSPTNFPVELNTAIFKQSACGVRAMINFDPITRNFRILGLNWKGTCDNFLSSLNASKMNNSSFFCLVLRFLVVSVK